MIALRQRIQKWIDSNTRAQKAYGEAIKGLQRELENTGAVTEEVYAKVNRTFTGITENAAKTGLAGQSMMEKLMAGYAKYGGWSIITRTMGSVFRQVYKVIDAVKELDAAMTELRKVTNLTEGAYSRFEKTAAQMAKRVGSSVSDAVNATADFARLGFELDESALFCAELRTDKGERKSLGRFTGKGLRRRTLHVNAMPCESVQLYFYGHGGCVIRDVEIIYENMKGDPAYV